LRKKHIIITSGGKNITPSNIENLLLQHPLIEQALVHGDRRNYLVALLALSPDGVKAWAQGCGLADLPYEELLKQPSLLQEVQKIVDQVNTRLARFESVKKFALLPRLLEVEKAELTPTLKIRRRVVEELKRNGREEHRVHRTVERPWGSYTVLEKGERYQIKRVVIHPNQKLSLQIHRHRSEHWVVISGTARVTRGNDIYYVHPNESTYIPVSTVHRLENPGRIPLQIIEVQNGDYVEEDDIERLDDDYGRA
jgi:mannose-6-phosphate isomerase-like protein (cupin superfamily)